MRVEVLDAAVELEGHSGVVVPGVHARDETSRPVQLDLQFRPRETPGDKCQPAP
jgi:hypothetical protein